MVNKRLTWLVIISLVLCLFAFTGCTGSQQEDEELNNPDATEETEQEEMSDIDVHTYQNSVDNFESELKVIQNDEPNASGAAAAGLKKLCDEIASDTEMVKTSVLRSVQKGYITPEEQASLDSSLEDIKSRATALATSLNEKAQGATVSDEDRSVGIARFITTEDQFTSALDSYEKSIGYLRANAREVTTGDKEYLTNLSANYRVHLNQLEARLTELVNDGTIPEDQKAGYEEKITDLKHGLDNADANIASAK